MKIESTNKVKKGLAEMLKGGVIMDVVNAEQAKIAESIGEVPVGAIIIKDDIIISKAHNQPISKNDPTAHAEIEAIRAACKTLNNYRINGSTLFVTLEPCIMCFGAIIHYRIERIVFGAFDNNKGICSTCFDSKKSKLHKNQIKITMYTTILL